MKTLINFFSLALLLSFSACNKSAEYAGYEMETDEVSKTSGDQNLEVIERKLIKEGDIEFETDNIAKTRNTVFQAAKKYKAYISSDQEFTYDDRISNTIVIRVPAKHFDDLLKDASLGVDHFESKEIIVRDVTEEFLDIQARLKTKKELEKRYLDLLKMAKNVTEILEIEKQIGLLRSDIESIEGRLKFLENKISLSTLSITFYESSPNSGFGNKFQNGFKNGWNNLIWFFVALVNVWPFIFLAVGLFVGFRLLRKRKK